MAYQNSPIKSAGDQTHIPGSQGESLAACARDISTPQKRKALDSPEGHTSSSRRESVHYVDNSDLRTSCSRGVRLEPPKPAPRFLVVESDIPEHPLTKCNIFSVGKWFEGVSSQLVGRFWKEGNIFIVDSPSAKVSEMLMKRNGTTFITLKIKVSAHRSMNSSKGVIWCPDLESLPEEEILENLLDQGVAKVERCRRTKGGLKVPTPTLFLTFNKPKLPEYITIVYQRVKVDLYVPKPLQCYKCYKFGHPSSKCKGKQVCGRCGYEDHVGSCPHPPLCPNCKGEHAPTSKTCPKYKEEHLIKSFMADRKIPFREAKKLVARQTEGSVPQKGKSFASAAASGISTLSSAPTSQANVVKKEKAMQFGLALPEALHAEALALARGLREELKKPKQDASAQFSADQLTEETGFSQTKSQRKKKAAKRRKLLANPGETPASAPKAAGAKQAQGPATSNSQAKPGDTPSSAPKPAGAKQAQEPAKPSPQAEPGKTSASASKPAGAKQAQEPAKPTSQAEPGATSASASKPAEENKREEVSTTDHSESAGEEQSSEAAPLNSESMDVAPADQTSGSEPEVPSASAPQAAEGGVEIVDLPESEGIEGSGSVPSSPFLDLAGGEFISPKKKKRWRKKAERDPIFQSLNRSPFEDPESF